MNNVNKAYIVLSLLFLGFIVIGYSWFGRAGLMWCTVLSLLIHWLLYFYADQKIFGTYSTHRVEGQDPWGVIPVLTELSEKAHIPRPQLYLYESPGINAFSLGKNLSDAKILVSRSSLTKLDQSQIRALLAHEIAKIKQRDTVLFSLLSSLLEISLVLTLFFERDNSRNQFESRRTPLHLFFLYLLAPLAYVLHKTLLSEKTYYDIDRGASKLLGSGEALINLLHRAQSYANNQALDVPVSMAHLFVVNPLTKPGWGRYFQAQPSTKARMSRLLENRA